MVVDKRKKKTQRAVNGYALKCCGAVTFQVTVGGQRTGVLALVTPSLNQEILLSWRTLQRLGIILKDFPNVAVKAVRAEAVVMSPRERLLQTMADRANKAVRANAVVVNPLREWRNTPRYDGLSPVQGLYGRRQ